MLCVQTAERSSVRTAPRRPPPIGLAAACRIHAALAFYVAARKDSRIQLTLTPGMRPPKARSPATASGAPPSPPSLLKKVASFLQRMVPAPVRAPVLALAQEPAQAAEPLARARARVRAPRARAQARARAPRAQVRTLERALERALEREEAQARVPEQERAPDRVPAQDQSWASIQVQHALLAAVLLPPAPRPCA